SEPGWCPPGAFPHPWVVSYLDPGMESAEMAHSLSGAAELRRPGAGLGSGQVERDLAGRTVDRLDAHADRVAETEPSPASPPLEGGAEDVQLEVVGAEQPRRQEALEYVAEAGEEPRADQADDLALERLLPALLVERAVEKPREADVVG